MTISSYPNTKLLIAIISAIAVGILVSWVWGIATFFILMFIFIFIASWIFGGPKGKVKVTYKLKERLDKLENIGHIKNELPLNARGWCNILGLYVQLRSKGGLSRLQAGDNKMHSAIDAWLDYSSVDKWKLKKYKPGPWEKLVDPTLEVAEWLIAYGGLPEDYKKSFIRAIKMFKKEGHLKLPFSTVESRTVANEPSKHDIIDEILRSDGAELLSMNMRNRELLDSKDAIIDIELNPFALTDSSYLTKAFLSQGLVSFDTERMDTILKKLLKDEYQNYFDAAKKRIISRQ